jgi:hypothetical protein
MVLVNPVLMSAGSRNVPSLVSRIVGSWLTANLVDRREGDPGGEGGEFFVLGPGGAERFA